MFKRAEGPYKLRVQITFGAACSPAPPHGCHRWRGAQRAAQNYCNPVVAWGLFSFSHVSLALGRGSLCLCCTASRRPPPPPPQLLRTSGSLLLGPYHEKHPTWEPCSTTRVGGLPGARHTRGQPGVGVPLSGPARAPASCRVICLLFSWL